MARATQDPPVGRRQLSDETQHHLIEATVHGRYLVRRAAKEPAPLLVCLHGYGENAERLLDEVLMIPGVSAWRVAAIQALHPFYNTKTGEVVASWMTKLDREEAIADNVRYVAEGVRRLREGAAAERPLVYLGYSQGTAMAYRAAALAGQPCTGVIALGGDVPPELAGEPLHAVPAVLIGRGADDTWYSEEKLGRDLAVLEAAGAEVEVCRFEGGHEWTDEFRGRCRDFLRSRVA